MIFGLQVIASQSYSGIISWGLQCSAWNTHFLTERILPEVLKSLHVALAIRQSDILHSMLNVIVRHSTIDIEVECSGFDDRRWMSLFRRSMFDVEVERLAFDD
jgi:hypothetical protein